MDENQKQKDQKSRRQILKALLVGGAATTVILPAAWQSPLVRSVIVPAHAQASPHGFSEDDKKKKKKKKRRTTTGDPNTTTTTGDPNTTTTTTTTTTTEDPDEVCRQEGFECSVGASGQCGCFNPAGNCNVVPDAPPCPDGD